MVVDVVPYQLLKFGKALRKEVSSCRLMGEPWQPQLTAPPPHRTYCCEKVDQSAIPQAVHSFIAWGKDCEGPRTIQDRWQPTVLQQQNVGLDRSLPQNPTWFLPSSANRELPLFKWET